MSKQEFPTWRYGPDGASKLCRTQEDLDGVDAGWADSPAAHHDAEQAKAAEGADDGASAAFLEGQRQELDLLPSGHTHRDRLEAQAKSLGVKFSKNTKDEELQERIFKAGSD